MSTEAALAPSPASMPAPASGFFRGLVPSAAVPTLLLAPLVIGAISVLIPSLWPIGLGLDAALLLVAVVDAARLARVGLTATRKAPRTWSVGRAETIRVHLEQRGRRRLTLQLHQALFPGCVADALPLAGSLGRVAELEFRAIATQRGKFTLGMHHVRVRSPWGLWWRQVDLPGDDPVHVFPDIKALVEYDLLARTGRQSLLVRPVRKPGNLAEFERLRPFAHGDEYRLVDWKATARAREPIVRQLRHATDQNVVFLLDLGRPMTASWNGRSAVDAALDALVLTGHVALRHHDKVGLIAFDSRIRAFLPPIAGPRARQSLLRATAGLQPTLDEPDYREAFAALRARVRSRSLVVLLSKIGRAHV